MEVKIMSRETMKPSIPTPSYLKYHKLSLLDQLAKMMYVLKFICYAPPAPKDVHISNVTTVARLKESLAEALTVFYPLAGRLTLDESAIDCNDAGIPFIVVRCDSPLSHFLDHPDRLDMVSRFLPSIIAPGPAHHTLQPRSLDVTELVLFAVQINIFNCGGVIIGTKGLHKILDATSCGMFLKTWSDFATGRVEDALNNKPDFGLAVTLYPPRSWAEVSPPRPPIPFWALDPNKVDGSCLSKVFEFSASSVTALCAKARSDRVPNPTRIEVVTGFIWKHVMVAASTNPRVFGPSAITHSVNMRPRTRPQLSPTAFGNLVFQAIARYGGGNNNNDNEAARKPELSELVAEVCEALSKAKDVEFLSKLQGEKGTEIVRQYNQKLNALKNDPNINTYRFSSWTKLSFEPDFELGMPVWGGYSGGRMSSSIKNLILLMMNPIHGTIEAFMILDEKEMEILVSDPEFLAFATPVDG